MRIGDPPGLAYKWTRKYLENLKVAEQGFFGRGHSGVHLENSCSTQEVCSRNTSTSRYSSCPDDEPQPGILLTSLQRAALTMALIVLSLEGKTKDTPVANHSVHYMCKKSLNKVKNRNIVYVIIKKCPLTSLLPHLKSSPG